MADNIGVFKNEEDIIKDKFVFVSYSHQNMDIVQEDINCLIEEYGARIWMDHRGEYEANLKNGENWDDHVKGIINNSNCVGIVFYVSEHFLSSDSIYNNEYLTALEKFGVENKEQRMYIVGVDEKKDMDQYYIDAIPLKPKYFYSPMMNKQLTFFSFERIFLKRTSHEVVVKNLLRWLEKHSVIYGREAVVVNSSRKSVGIYTLGVYKDGLNDNQLIKHPGKDNLRFTSGGNEYIRWNEKIYSTKRLRWVLLHADSTTAVLISEGIIDSCRAVEVQQFFDDFRNMAFDSEENIIVKKVRLFSLSDEERLEKDKREELLAPFHEEDDASWWIEDRGVIEDSWRLAYKGTQLYGSTGFPENLTKGFRPVIEIDIKDLEKCK